MHRSEIPDVAEERFMKVRGEFITICGDVAAGVLLSVMDGWMIWKAGQREQAALENKARAADKSLDPIEVDDWIYNTYEGWAKDCLGVLKEYEVKKGLAILEKKGFISKRNNPKYRWDRTLQYRMNVGAVREAIAIRYPQPIHPSPVPDRRVAGEPAIPTAPTTASNNKKSSAKKEISYTQQEFAIAKACALDLQTITGKHLGMLRNAGRKLAEVDDKTILGFRSWWKTRWEGRGGGAPRLDELLNKWGAYMENRKPPPGEDREWIETVKAAAAKAREQCQKSATSATSP